MNLQIDLADNHFSDWSTLLTLLHDAFAFMEDRIDPPSSLHLLTPELIAAKSQKESLFLATDGDELIGCVFAKPGKDSIYVGKLAVHPDHQRKSIGRNLMRAVEQYASDAGISTLKLDTRIELTENHSTFTSMGYIVTGEHSHDGYDRPTYISMQKILNAG